MEKEFIDHYSGLQVTIEDGEVFVPKSGIHPAHYTYGCKKPDGHRVVRYKGKLYLVHIIVAECFLNGGEPIDTKTYDVHHINGNPEDNRVSNLLILTHEEHTALHMKGKVLSEEHKQKIVEAHKIPIIGVNKETGCTVEFESVSDAERVLGIDHSNISACCKGKRQSAGGWRFEYKNPLSA